MKETTQSKSMSFAPGKVVARGTVGRAEEPRMDRRTRGARPEGEGR